MEGNNSSDATSSFNISLSRVKFTAVGDHLVSEVLIRKVWGYIGVIDLDSWNPSTYKQGKEVKARVVSQYK